MEQKLKQLEASGIDYLDKPQKRRALSL